MEETETYFYHLRLFISINVQTLYKQQKIYGDGGIGKNNVHKFFPSFKSGSDLEVQDC